jgi:hypothetical protein
MILLAIASVNLKNTLCRWKKERLFFPKISVSAISTREKLCKKDLHKGMVKRQMPTCTLAIAVNTGLTLPLWIHSKPLNVSAKENYARGYKVSKMGLGVK